MENPYKRSSKINPQRENGHRQIANDVYRALILAKLSGAEYQLILFIIDKSWGFNKISDGIPYSQMQKASNLSRPGVINTIKKLEERRILIVNRIIEKDRLPVNEYLFNKHYDTWIDKTGKAQFTTLEVEEFIKLVKHSLPVRKQTSKQMKQTSKQMKQKESKLVKHSLPSKEILVSKETLSKETLSKDSFDKEAVVYQLVIYLEGKIRENNKSIQKRTESQLQSWYKDMDYLTRIDKAKPNEIKKIIDWVVEDKFWAKNILCPASLRKHYPRFYKEVIDRGRSLEEKVETDHRLDDVN